MKKTIIFGNGINDNLLKNEVINIHKYIYQKINESINILKKECKYFHDINELIKYLEEFNENALKEKWTFDVLYTAPYVFMILIMNIKKNDIWDYKI